MKSTVLVFVRYYLPGYKSGGPIRTISNMVDHLGDEFDFRIVTSDRDALDDAPYPNVDVDAWSPIGKAQVYYASPGNRSVRALARIIRQTPYDVLYLNSFFDPVFTMRPLMARRLGWLPRRPVVIAPRGEFSLGALALKRWKKLPYMYASRAFRLYRDLTWQASSEHEEADIQRVMGTVAKRVMVAQDLPSLAVNDGQTLELATTRSGPLRVVFLSRITPMKNLDFALRVLRRVQITLVFNIYGPIRDNSYWQRCQELISELPAHITVQYHGSVGPDQVFTILSQHDLFFLPTLGENYGHVILESLTTGTPVLIADTTPWRNLEQLGVGWDLSLESEQTFAERIASCAAFDQQTWINWRHRVMAYAHERLKDSQVTNQNRCLFLQELNQKLAAL